MGDDPWAHLLGRAGRLAGVSGLGWEKLVDPCGPWAIYPLKGPKLTPRPSWL